MTRKPDRRKAGRAVAERMAQLHLSVPLVAEIAHVDATTLRRLLRGDVWPQEDTRRRIAVALRWPPAEIARIAETDDAADARTLTTAQLMTELCRRYNAT